jgi:hypothetical protein
MATFHGQTVDIYEDFEDTTLNAELTVIDPAGIVTVSDTNRYMVGTHSMSVDVTTGVNTSNVQKSFGASPCAKASVGFWYYTCNWTSNGKEMQFCYFRGGGIMLKLITAFDSQDWLGNRNIGFIEFPTSNYITVSSATWYWVTVIWEQGVGTTLRVYDTSHNQVGSDITALGGQGVDNHTQTIDDIHIGITDEFANFAGKINFDEYVVDYTDGTFPLLGWDTTPVSNFVERGHTKLIF